MLSGKILGKALPRKNSDHEGLLVSLINYNGGPKPFGVFNMWLQNDSPKKAIYSNLRVEVSADAQSVIRKARDIIRSWNKEDNGNIFKKIELAESKIVELEDLTNPGFELILAKEELEELLLIKDSMIKQQSRIGWLQKGDRNSKFFHQTVQRRRA